MRRIAFAALAVALTLLAAGCGGSSRKAAVTTTPAAPSTAFFAYDKAQPVSLIDSGRVNPAYPIAVRDFSYASGDTRVPGYLILPPGKGKLPAVVYLHGPGGDRRQFLLPGSWLVARGAIVLTITAPSTT
ncbi:MAG: alpha/beta hydrolase family protein, partial [Gaiellaceae bacterium]